MKEEGAPKENYLCCSQEGSKKTRGSITVLKGLSAGEKKVISENAEGFNKIHGTSKEKKGA